jgi:hypothetical protein
VVPEPDGCRTQGPPCSAKEFGPHLLRPDDPDAYYFFSTLIWQSSGPEDEITTLESGGAVTLLLSLPSADLTVTERPPEPVVLDDTLPPPAVTLVDVPPAEELPDIEPLPALATELFTLQPPLVELETDELLVWAVASETPRKETAAIAKSGRIMSVLHALPKHAGTLPARFCRVLVRARSGCRAAGAQCRA